MLTPARLSRFFALALAIGALGACAKPIKPAPACVAAVACYFGDKPDHLLRNKRGFEGLGDAALFRNTYDTGGSCWSGDTALAHACEDRCRGLLWQDCNATYNQATPGTPFCADLVDGGVLAACAFPEECRRGKDASLCADGTGCSAPNPKPEPVSFGCCLPADGGPLPGGNCAYAYGDPADRRAPAGNPEGTVTAGAAP